MKRGTKFWLMGSALAFSALPLTMGARPVSTAPSQPFYLTEVWDTAWSYNAFADNAVDFSPLTTLSLAYQMRPQENYVPMLAKRWTVTPKAITVYLRSGAKWQNGKPFTSTDVLDTFEIYGAESSLIGAENGITNITAPTAHEVVFALAPGASTTAMLSNILGTYLVPASEYGQFVTPSLLKEDLIADSGKSGPAVSKAAAYTKAVMDKVLKFQPKSLLGDGPYRLTAMTTAEAVMKKWSGFYDAAKIHVPEIVGLQSTQALGDLTANRMDLSGVGASYSFIKHWEQASPYHKTKKVWDWSVFDWYLNTKHYPLNLVGVRQAIAYVLNRPLLTEIADGFMRNDPTAIENGLQQVSQNQWLTPQELAHFHKYSHNPQKATKILEGLHFKKTRAGWIMPNGKPFTLSIIMPAGYTGPTISGTEAATELTQFGIKTKATAVEQPGYWSEQYKGQFQISWGWGGQWSANPLQEFYDILVSENYTPHEPGYVGLGFGPVFNVPGLGKVNLTKQLTYDVNHTLSKAKITKLTLDYAKLFNEQLPVIQYNSKRDLLFYSTQSYSDWPTKLVYWNQYGGNINVALMLMMLHGFIRPR